MATLSIVATVEANNLPPRVRLNISDTGTPAINSVTVTRTDAAGNVATVRTSDGNPLLLIGTTTRTAVIYDYEMPYGVTATYSTAEQPAVTATATVNEGRPWLIHPGIPDRSVRITVAEWGENARKANQGVFRPLGRSSAVVVSDGSRKSVEGALTLLTLTAGERAALIDLLADSAVLLLNVPASLGWGVDPCYVSFGDVTEARAVRISVDPVRRWQMPYVVIDAPVGGSQSQWTWANVIAQYPTWTALMAAQPTWANVIAPTS